MVELEDFLIFKLIRNSGQLKRIVNISTDIIIGLVSETARSDHQIPLRLPQSSDQTGEACLKVQVFFSGKPIALYK